MGKIDIFLFYEVGHGKKRYMCIWLSHKYQLAMNWFETRMTSHTSQVLYIVEIANIKLLDKFKNYNTSFNVWVEI